MDQKVLVNNLDIESLIHFKIRPIVRLAVTLISVPLGSSFKVTRLEIKSLCYVRNYHSNSSKEKWLGKVAPQDQIFVLFSRACQNASGSKNLDEGRRLKGVLSNGIKSMVQRFCDEQDHR